MEERAVQRAERRKADLGREEEKTRRGEIGNKSRMQSEARKRICIGLY